MTTILTSDLVFTYSSIIVPLLWKEGAAYINVARGLDAIRIEFDYQLCVDQLTEVCEEEWFIHTRDESYVPINIFLSQIMSSLHTVDKAKRIRISSFINSTLLSSLSPPSPPTPLPPVAPSPLQQHLPPAAESPPWVADKDAKECMVCLQLFTIFRRRHHVSTPLLPCSLLYFTLFSNIIIIIIPFLVSNVRKVCM